MFKLKNTLNNKARASAPRAPLSFKNDISPSHSIVIAKLQ